MRIRALWLACGLLAITAVSPAARAQAPNVGDPSWQFPLPLMLDQKESGFYFSTEAMFMRINNPIENQVIAVRGFVDESGQLRGQGPLFDIFDGNQNTGTFQTRVFTDPGPPGAFYGSGDVALDTTVVNADSYQPGWRLTFGYRLRNDAAVELVYWKLMEARDIGGAGILPPNFNVNNDFSNSFLFAPFFNFPTGFAGPTQDVVSNVLPTADPSGTAGTGFVITAQDDAEFDEFGGVVRPAFGIWNGAENMTIELIQRMWNAEINFRIPVHQSECTRTYTMVGPRTINLYERFRLRTEDADVRGDLLGEWVATYYNEWENRLYGGQVGWGSEVYLGSGFAFSLEGRVGIFANAQHTTVKVEREDRGFSLKKTTNDTHVSPMVQLGAYLWWYPIEGVQMRMGYEFLGIANVLRSTNPVDFDLGRLSPTYNHEFFSVDGWNGGVAFIF